MGKEEGKMRKTLLSVVAVSMLLSVAVRAQDFDEPLTGSARELDEFTTAQMKAVTAHKTLAFTTGGLLLAAGGLGAWHFLEMQRISHRYRDRIGFDEEAVDLTPQINEIRAVWSRSDSQAFRVAHAALIVSAVATYSATAAIELSWPDIDKSPSKWNNTAVHRRIFWLHATMMVANAGLGFAESWALSRGNHELVTGLGIAHLAIGFSVPVVMFASGLAFKLPEKEQDQ
jgi:hypothetical protein